MLNLAEYRKKSKMLADFLPWAALVGPGELVPFPAIAGSGTSLQLHRCRYRRT